jgi:DNA topoisomerase-3
MTKKLIIAEKPSVAADITRALGGFSRKGDYFESDDYVVSSAVGHLLELAVPEEFDVKRGKWSFTHLPVIPPRFELAPIERGAARRDKNRWRGNSAWCCVPPRRARRRYIRAARRISCR